MTTTGATPYHHGALRQALITATEALLDERGADGFSLREVARRAGVSPAAPAHHFGDAAGLLTAVATLGFEELARVLRAGSERGGADAGAALREQGVEYVQFAVRHPGRFRLMFRSGRLRDDVELARHGSAAFAVLDEGVGHLFGVEQPHRAPGPARNAVLAMWSLVHGFAHLAIAGKFDEVAAGEGIDAFIETSLRPMLDAMVAGLRPIAAAGTAAAAAAAGSGSGSGAAAGAGAGAVRSTSSAARRRPP